MNTHYKFINPPLPYSYDFLEPYIDTKTMILHHDRHLQTYVNNLNLALENYPQYHNKTLEELLYLIDTMPTEIQSSIKNNAGGVYNHVFYFYNLTNPSPKKPIGKLSDEINLTFGNFENFKAKFTQSALSVFGSGYAWLVLDKNKKLKIITTKNQDTPLELGLCPILNIDVWEHAYYLKHYNLRNNYIKNWFEVINWYNANNTFIKQKNIFLY